MGTDIIEISRIRKAIERHAQDFLNRIYTKKEQELGKKYKDPTPFFAGRFAAKEAIAKAFGTGIGADLSWEDLEILNDENGKPIVFLSKNVEKQFGKVHCLLSLSHSEDYATSVALLTKS